jgi:uncharacterized CHY-type Zn-finger protein
MKQEVCVLPVQCKKCGAIFDLYYDLQELERSDLLPSRRMAERAIRESLCWHCRKDALRALNSGGEEVEEMDEFLIELE